MKLNLLKNFISNSDNNLILLIIGTVGIIIYIFKIFIDTLMMNKFDKILIPKLKRNWSDLIGNFGFSIIINAILTLYSFSFTELILEIELIKLIATLIFLITTIIIMINIFVILIKEIKISSATIVKQKNNSKNNKENNSIKNKIKKIYNYSFNFIILVNIYSIVFLYIFLIPKYYDFLSMDTINAINSLKTLIAFILISIITCIYILFYKFIIRESNNSNLYESDYVMKIADPNLINKNDIYIYYKRDENSLVLGNSRKISTSDKIYLYEKENNKLFEFEKIE